MTPCPLIRSATLVVITACLVTTQTGCDHPGNSFQLTADGYFVVASLADIQSAPDGLSEVEGRSLTDAALKALSKFRTLDKLRLVDCDSVTDDGLTHLTKYRSLTCLGLSSCDGLSNKSFETLIRLRSLDDLSLRSGRMTEEGLGTLASGRLKILDLRGWRDLTDECLRNAAKIASLEILDVGIFSRRPISIVFGNELNQGLHAVPSPTQGASQRRNRFTTAGFEALSQSKNLRGLRLAGSELDDQTLQPLHTIPTLEILDLSSTAVTDLTLQRLGSLPSLLHLDVSDTIVTGKGLSGLRALRTLFVRSSGMSTRARRFNDDDLRHLRPLRNLLHVDLTNQHHVGDPGAALLGELTSLEDVDLNGTSVSDTGLQRLTTLTKLQLLDVAGTHVTEQGVLAFQAALPKCTVLR